MVSAMILFEKIKSRYVEVAERGYVTLSENIKLLERSDSRLSFSRLFNLAAYNIVLLLCTDLIIPIILIDGVILYVAGGEISANLWAWGISVEYTSVFTIQLIASSFYWKRYNEMLSCAVIRGKITYTSIIHTIISVVIIIPSICFSSFKIFAYGGVMFININFNYISIVLSLAFALAPIVLPTCLNILIVIIKTYISVYSIMRK